MFKRKNNNKSESTIMSIEDLQNTDINLDIIKEALNQAEKLLKDFLETKNGINQKLFILFGSFLTVLTILFSAIFVILSDNNYSNYNYLLYLLIPLCYHFVISLIFFLVAFRNVNFGTIGTPPDFWLRKNTINGDQKRFALKLAYTTYSYQNRIDETYKSNESKIVLQHSGLYISLIGIILSPFTCFSYYLYQYLSYPFLLFVVLVLCPLLCLLSPVVCYRIAKLF